MWAIHHCCKICFATRELHVDIIYIYQLTILFKICFSAILVNEFNILHDIWNVRDSESTESMTFVITQSCGLHSTFLLSHLDLYLTASMLMVNNEQFALQGFNISEIITTFALVATLLVPVKWNMLHNLNRLNINRTKMYLLKWNFNLIWNVNFKGKMMYWPSHQHFSHENEEISLKCLLGKPCTLIY